MKVLLRKLFNFIKNPLSGYFFYLACVILFLIMPLEGFGAIAFVFLLPFVLFIIIGLNLSFFSVLFNRFTMSKDKKRNHALEHGTIYFIKKRFGTKFRVGGHAEKDGFRISGVSNKQDIVKAFNQFSKEYNIKNPELFISLKCGSNIATAQGFGLTLLTISAIFLKMFNPPDFIIALVLLLNVALYALLRNIFGNWIQGMLFMATDFTKARIHSINIVKKKIYWEKNPVFFIKTIID